MEKHYQIPNRDITDTLPDTRIFTITGTVGRSAARRRREIVRFTKNLIVKILAATVVQWARATALIRPIPHAT